MTWKPDQIVGNEVRKTRPRVIKYLRGLGLDLRLDFGAGEERIVGFALTAGLGKNATIQTDHTSPGCLAPFADGSMDYVFSAFTLQMAIKLEIPLREWWRVLKPGGRLILYLPHKDHYPRAGHPGHDPRYKHDLEAKDVLAAMDRIEAAYQVEVNEVHAEDDEYAFELVLAKRMVRVPTQDVVSPRQRKAVVIRYGGFGDAIIALAVIRELKRQGYRVTFLTQERGFQVAQHEPAVDELVNMTANGVPEEAVQGFWDRLNVEYDRVINLSGTMEQKLLFRGPGSPDAPDKEMRDKGFDLPHGSRHALANRNYMEFLLEHSGMPNLAPDPPRMHLTEDEKRIGLHYRHQHREAFLVAMTMGGSADHKAWMHARHYGEALLKEFPEAYLVLVGDKPLQMLEWRQERVERKCGIMPFRSSCIVASVADLVVTTETGFAHAAAGFQTPTIVLLSHSSEENLTKHWKSAVSVRPPVPCHPCHQLHYTPTDCPVDQVALPLNRGETFGAPICTTQLTVEMVMAETRKIHAKWRDSRRLWFGEGVSMATGPARKVAVPA